MSERKRVPKFYVGETVLIEGASLRPYEVMGIGDIDNIGPPNYDVLLMQPRVGEYARAMIGEAKLFFPDPVLQYFRFQHLPAHLQEASVPFWGLAHKLAAAYPMSNQLALGLQRLLEAKDCAVRAALVKWEDQS